MRKITNELIKKFKGYLIDEEKSPSTLDKYIRDITVFMKWCKETELSKSVVLEYKQDIVEKYAPASVNSILSSLNSFFAYNEWYDLKVKALKIQRQIFASKDKELTKAEYERLLVAAKQKKNQRLYYLILCDQFMKGATESGNEVEIIRVTEINIGFCKACYACKDTGVCAIKDDMAEVLQKMIDAEVIVLASPIYFYSVDAQLKALMDRTFARGLEVKDKEFYYIVTAGDARVEFAQTTIACFRGYTGCLEGAKEVGIIYGMGVFEKGEIRNTKAMTEAYEMGKNV